MSAAFDIAAQALTAEAERLIARGEAPAAEPLGAALAALARLFAMGRESGALAGPVMPELPATAAAELAKELLRAADISLFDLAMWVRRA
jgi:hypothetical protein